MSAKASHRNQGECSLLCTGASISKGRRGSETGETGRFTAARDKFPNKNKHALAKLGAVTGRTGKAVWENAAVPRQQTNKSQWSNMTRRATAERVLSSGGARVRLSHDQMWRVTLTSARNDVTLAHAPPRTDPYFYRCENFHRHNTIASQV